MFEKIKADNFGIGIDEEGKLTFSCKLDNEEQQLKAAGRISLKKCPAGYDDDDMWILEGNCLTLKLNLKKDSKEVSLGSVRKTFEEMVS